MGAATVATTVVEIRSCLASVRHCCCVTPGLPWLLHAALCDVLIHVRAAALAAANSTTVEVGDSTAAAVLCLASSVE